MSVYKRKTSNGETPEYHYDFIIDGKRYCGVCEGCITKETAQKYEINLKGTVKQAAKQKSVRALVDNFREQLTGGTSISLDEAYELSLKKPRQRQPSAELISVKRSYWNDFVQFTHANYPEVINLSDVQVKHAEAYIQQLRTNGRFNKLISYSGKTNGTKKEYLHKGQLSAKTINTYQQVLTEVFSLLSRDAGIIDNPFSSIPKLRKDAETRDAFTQEELNTIYKNADDFILPLFTIAISTALREGDICTLKWEDIDFNRRIITKKMHKTGNYVEIPIMLPLMKFLFQCRERCNTSEYVLPKHAEMYAQNSSGISYRIKRFLEKDCGIKTTRQAESRGRAVSVKDLHSCRHTFCYFAGLYGIPLSIVQSIVGHMSPEMTKHYSAHASLEAKREQMKQLPAFLMLGDSTNAKLSQSNLRQDLIRRIEELPEEKLHQALELLCKLTK